MLKVIETNKTPSITKVMLLPDRQNTCLAINRLPLSLSKSSVYRSFALLPVWLTLFPSKLFRLSQAPDMQREGSLSSLRQTPPSSHPASQHPVFPKLQGNLPPFLWLYNTSETASRHRAREFCVPSKAGGKQRGKKKMKASKITGKNNCSAFCLT